MIPVLDEVEKDDGIQADLVDDDRRRFVFFRDSFWLQELDGIQAEGEFDRVDHVLRGQEVDDVAEIVVVFAATTALRSQFGGGLQRRGALAGQRQDLLDQRVRLDSRFADQESRRLRPFRQSAKIFEHQLTVGRFAIITAEGQNQIVAVHLRGHAAYRKVQKIGLARFCLHDLSLAGCRSRHRQGCGAFVSRQIERPVLCRSCHVRHSIPSRGDPQAAAVTRPARTRAVNCFPLGVGRGA